MRKVLLVLAGVPLVLAPVIASPALAHVDRSAPEGEARCPVPTVETNYDADLLTVHVSLPASGCAAREHSMFELATTVTRMDNHGSHDVSDETATCGPFRSADDFEAGDNPPQYSCNLAMAVDHPQVEAAQYDIDLTYPGDSGERSMTYVVFCRSDGEQASCEDLGQPAERETQP